MKIKNEKDNFRLSVLEILSSNSDDLEGVKRQLVRSLMHYLSIPVVPDPKHKQGIKVCCDNVINRKELRNFHPDLDMILISPEGYFRLQKNFYFKK